MSLSDRKGSTAAGQENHTEMPIRRGSQRPKSGRGNGEIVLVRHTGLLQGGPIAFRTAAAVPDRVGAVASFGDGLVIDAPNSPHLQPARSKAQFLIAIAENDDARAPNDKKTVLKETFAKANLLAEIEVYAGAAHGWCPPDSRVYNQAQAEKAWRLLVLLRKSSGVARGHPPGLSNLILPGIKKNDASLGITDIKTLSSIK